MKLFIGLILSTSVFAAGSGHGSPSDLIPSFVNVAILAAALLYILVPKLKIMFSEKSSNVTEVMERASVKAKEAKMLMEVQNKKIESLDDEIQAIRNEGDQEINGYKNLLGKDVEARISALKVEAGKKIETEKQELANNLNEQLLDEVIAQAKSKIKADGNLSSEATSKILQGLN